MTVHAGMSSSKDETEDMPLVAGGLTDAMQPSEGRPRCEEMILQAETLEMRNLPAIINQAIWDGLTSPPRLPMGNAHRVGKVANKLIDEAKRGSTPSSEQMRSRLLEAIRWQPKAKKVHVVLEKPQDDRRPASGGYGGIEELPLGSLREDEGLQMRVSMSAAHVEALLEILNDGRALEPVSVLRDGDGVYHLWDGMHRLRAHRKAGSKTIRAMVMPGGRRDAILRAVGANNITKLNRTPEDKRKAVSILLADDEWKSLSARAIAEKCNVSATLVGDVIKELSARDEQLRQARCGTLTAQRGGSTYEMNVGGLRKPAPSPTEPPPSDEEESEPPEAEEAAPVEEEYVEEEETPVLEELEVEDSPPAPVRTPVAPEKVGVSEKQVREDIKTATAEGSAVEQPEKVTGRDGRMVKATRDPRPVEPLPSPVQPRPAEPMLPESQVPSHLRDMLQDAVLPDILKGLQALGRQYDGAKIARDVRKRLPGTPWMRGGTKMADFLRAAEALRENGDLAIELLETSIAVAVCPACEGQAGRGCGTCHGHEVVPGWVRDSYGAEGAESIGPVAGRRDDEQDDWRSEE